MFPLAAVLLALLIGETILRLGVVGPTVGEMREFNSQLYRTAIRGYWEHYDNQYPWLPYRVRPVADQYRNEKGYIGPDFDWQKPPNTYRVACLGGSTTFQGTYPLVIAAVLDQATPMRVEALNFGAEGWTTSESLVNYAVRGCHADLDAIVVYQNINDVPPAACPEAVTAQPDYSHFRKRLQDPPKSWIIGLPLSWDRLAIVATSRYIVFRGEAGDSWRNWNRHYAFDAEAPFLGDATYRSNLHNIIAIALSRGTRVFLVTQLHSEKHSVENFKGPVVSERVRQLNQTLREVSGQYAATGQVHLIDAEKEAVVLKRQMVDHCHFTDQGYQQLGVFIARNMLEFIARPPLATATRP